MACCVPTESRPLSSQHEPPVSVLGDDDHSGKSAHYNICEILVIRLRFGDEYGCRKPLKASCDKRTTFPPKLARYLASLTESTPSNDASAVMEAAFAARPAQTMQRPPTDNEAAAFARAVDDVQQHHHADLRRRLGTAGGQWAQCRRACRSSDRHPVADGCRARTGQPDQ